MTADTRVRRGAYTLKGKRAIYTYTGSHARTVVFELITDDGPSFFKRYNKFTKDEFANFLKEAHAQFGKPIMMILDRAPSTRPRSSRRCSRIWAGRSSSSKSEPPAAQMLRLDV